MVHFFTLGIFLIFLVSYMLDRRRVINGFLFSLFIFSAYLSLAYQALTYRQSFFFYLFLLLSFIWIGILLFGGFLLVIFCFLNARIVFKKEGRRLQNSLTLLLGMLLIGVGIISLLNVDYIFPEYIVFILSFGRFCLGYIALFFVEFSLSAFLYQFYYPRYNKDYIIVLGSGLIDGYIVPPLLQNRINKALDFYFKQKKETGKNAMIIFSGGKGDDEHLSEAEAMKQFALEQGLPEEDVIVEDQSVNTQENMLFSKQIMERRSPNGYKVIFSTNNFHLLRAGIYARRVHLKAQGIGAKTAFYFLPNAFIREFVAYLNLYRYYHLTFVALAFFWMLLGELIT
ncbi:MAG: YdcF family protein [Enterococcus faecium]|nr:YdcF family protein [Enterococcus faecium]MBS6011678.1 YdcF family protein [Enterococcus faecium]